MSDLIRYLSEGMFDNAANCQRNLENANRMLVVLKDAIASLPPDGAQAIAQNASIQAALNVVETETKNTQIYRDAGYMIQALLNPKVQKSKDAPDIERHEDVEATAALQAVIDEHFPGAEECKHGFHSTSCGMCISPQEAYPE